MERPKEEPPLLDRASRATRGKRMSKLLDDELEEDELFWNQDALREEENDENYEEEPEVADEFDSDFDDDEPEPDDDAEIDVEERVRKKKRLIFPGKSLRKKKKKKDISELKSASEDDKHAEQSDQVKYESRDINDDAEGEKVVRKSTRTAVVVRQAERDAIRAALQATTKPIKRKKEGEEKRMTQEEMLLEAAQTEIQNLRNLERVLAREEEVKKKAIVHKSVYQGPQIRYLSRNGSSYLEFCQGAKFESEISNKAAPYPEKAICCVTGLPAKYRDSKTGLPYATKEAFKVIRERFIDEARGARQETSMGELYDSLSGKGFVARQRRSSTPNKCEMLHFRRFHRFPDLESDESD